MTEETDCHHALEVFFHKVDNEGLTYAAEQYWPDPCPLELGEALDRFDRALGRLRRVVDKLRKELDLEEE